MLIFLVIARRRSGTCTRRRESYREDAVSVVLQDGKRFEGFGGMHADADGR